MIFETTFHIKKFATSNSKVFCTLRILCTVIFVDESSNNLKTVSKRKD